jgi:hypothetical protein
MVYPGLCGKEQESNPDTAECNKTINAEFLIVDQYGDYQSNGWCDVLEHSDDRQG